MKSETDFYLFIFFLQYQTKCGKKTSKKTSGQSQQKSHAFKVQVCWLKANTGISYASAISQKKKCGAKLATLTSKDT